MRLIRSELMKIRTTNVWWLFGIGILLFTGIFLWVWMAVGSDQIDTAIREAGQPFPMPPPDSGMSPTDIDNARRQWEVQHDPQRAINSALSQIYTSGQFMNAMFVMLLGAILVTNEFYHQTATATFLTTPKRTKVILGKLATAVLAAGFFWAVTTVICIVAGAILMSSKGYGLQLDQWPVLRSILMNGLAYGLWGVLGIGLGVLIRNQIGAVITGVVGYLLGTQLAQLVIFLFAALFDLAPEETIKLIVFWPSFASQIMVTPEIDAMFPGAPQWWVGALVLVGYGVVFGTVGTLITRKRDIT